MTHRQARDLPLDSHLHTDLSHDSDVPIDDYARQAIERAIPEIAITDHVDFSPDAPGYGSTTFEQRERVVREAAARWADAGVRIHFGVEITWDGRWEADIREHLDRHAYDFVIGSVHIYRDSVFAPDRIARWVDGRSLSEVVAPYFDEVAAGARSGLFDAMGHIDFVKRWLVDHVDIRPLPDALELYEPILRALVDTGAALEINTSGLRQPPRETYPPASVTRRFVDLGGRAITIGSDAHRADSFAFGLDEGYGAMVEAGVDAVSFGRAGAARRVAAGATPNAMAGRSL
jgi:histidinol-phosphatase (PHP family)